MSVMLETTLGDIVIDLDVEGSEILCRNFLKLVKARYYTNTLVYSVVQNRFCQLGDPRGDGTGGSSIHGLIDAVERNLDDVASSSRRFLSSRVGGGGGGAGGGGGSRELTPRERRMRGVVAMTNMGGVDDTLGSQFLITLHGGEGFALDGMTRERALSLGVVAEDDDDVLTKINALYCDEKGRPYTDVRVRRALVVHDPYDDPTGMDAVLRSRGVDLDPARRISPPASPRSRPAEERVEPRIPADEALDDDGKTQLEREEASARKEAKSRAVVLEMLGDLPDADARAPDNVLFVCKLNPVTDDEDLELIFSRFDPDARAHIVRDQETGDSLCYAFVEFTTDAQCNEAYFKMNNVLLDDRRIRVDFSQSVSKEWNRFAQRARHAGGAGGGRGGGGGGGGGRRPAHASSGGRGR